MLVGLSKAQPAAWDIDDSGGEFGLNTGLKIKVIINGEPAETGFLGAMGPGGLFNGYSDIAFEYNEHFIDDPTMTSGHYFQLQIFGTPDEVYTLYFSPDGNQELLLAPTYTFVSNDLRFLEFTYTAPVNCVGDFDEWTTCSGGTQSKTYSVTQAAAGTGTACTHSNGHTETQSCQGADGAACTQGSECVSGTCTNSLCAAASTSVTETIQLSTGWNWISSSIDSLQNVSTIFKDGFEQGDEIKCQLNGAVYYTGWGWFAAVLDLTSFPSARMCKIYVKGPRSITITGTATSSKTYNLLVGWNWLGIPTLSQTKLKDWLADAGWQASDELKYQLSGAVYYDDYGWFSSTMDKDTETVPNIIVKQGAGAKLYKQTAGTYTYTV